jgi:hypothetical protein
LDAGLGGLDDERQLAYAADCACVLYSHNASDFFRLHAEWVAAGREHAGIILAPQQQYSIGEQLRRVLRIRARISAEGMRNRIEFLTNWDR